MRLFDRIPIPKPRGSQLLISLLIAGLGWYSGQALSQVDQDLRIMYTEYTLGAADLAHISADVMRYRNTIIRALEAHSQKEFERITESLPTQRAKIQHAIDRYAAAGLRVSRSGRSEPEDIEAVRRSLDQYFSVASTTVQLLTQEWTMTSPTDREALRRKAEEHASDNAGPKMIQVSLALDRLLDTVADVAKDMRDEGTRTIQTSSSLLVGGSFSIAFLNLFIGRRRSGHDEPSVDDQPASHEPGTLRDAAQSPAPILPSDAH
ncbi:MAG TPA: MCP four helix bundle domain-containing protein [Nitrospira sp.]|nr:MCP four helix bundle domain-containing protein [Nitrospira sp.]